MKLRIRRSSAVPCRQGSWFVCWLVVCSLGCFACAQVTKGGVDKVARYFRVVDEEGQPLTNIWMSVSTVGGVRQFGTDGRTETNGLGVVMLPTGTAFRVWASPTLGSPYHGSCEVASDGGLSGTSASEVMVRKSKTISGRLVGGDAKGVSNVLVTCLWRENEGSETRSSYTDSNGAFTISMITAPEGKIEFRIPYDLAFWVEPKSMELSNAVSRLVELRTVPKEEATVACRFYVVEGTAERVVEYDGDLGYTGPVGGMAIIKKGRFTLWNLPPGAYCLQVPRIEASGYRLVESNLTVATGMKDAKFRVEPFAGGQAALPPSRTRVVRGRVTAEDGSPLTECEVVVVGKRGWEQKTVSGSNGVFEVLKVPMSGAGLIARCQGYAPKTMVVESKGDDLGDIVVKKGVEVELKVVSRGKGSDSGRVEKGVVVLMDRSTGLVVAGVKLQVNEKHGAFRVLPGMYDVVWSDERGLSQALPRVEIKGSGAVEIAVGHDDAAR